MKYIVMCGGTYRQWETPRHILPINGEPIVGRTIRMLKENGIEDIAISSNNPIFEQFGVPVLKHDNKYVADAPGVYNKHWVDAFYPTEDPVCYLFGDVVYSPEAIKTIIEAKTEDIEFFASSPPFAPEYVKPWAEPFALKVANTDHLKQAVLTTRQYADMGLFKRPPIMWELWQAIKGTPLNHIDYGNYTTINDYTCDVDCPEDIELIENVIR